jgi:arsenate reductase
MVKVYCYSKCTTCKKALKWLDDNSIKYESLDIKGQHPDRDTIKKLNAKSGLPLKKFLTPADSCIEKWNCQKSFLI